jgi:hypothetical protein
MVCRQDGRQAKLAVRDCRRRCCCEKAEPGQFGGLLRANRERPTGHRSTKQCDELAPPHGHCPQAEKYTLSHFQTRAALRNTAKLACQCLIWVKRCGASPSPTAQVVRFPPDSDRFAEIPKASLRANSGSRRRVQRSTILLKDSTRSSRVNDHDRSERRADDHVLDAASE